MMKRIISAVLTGVLLVISLAALADHGDERREGYRRGRAEGHWEGREIHRFAERDLRIWRGGNWHHGRHDGRLGWWWIAAGVWYFYPEPVYPYPDPYIPPVTVINQQPPVVVPQQSVPVQPQPPVQTWYYCDSAKGYYPYVSSCPEGWRAVAAQPPKPAP